MNEAARFVDGNEQIRCVFELELVEVNRPVVNVGHGQGDVFNVRETSDHLLASRVNGALHRGAVLGREGREQRGEHLVPRVIEVHRLVASAHTLGGVGPHGLDLSAEQSVGYVGQSRVAAAMEVFEARSGRLENGQVTHSRFDHCGGSTSCANLSSAHVHRLNERMTVRLAIDGHAIPDVLRDLHVNFLYVAVFAKEFCSQRLPVFFNCLDGVVTGNDITGKLLN